VKKEGEKWKKSETMIGYIKRDYINGLEYSRKEVN